MHSVIPAPVGSGHIKPAGQGLQVESPAKEYIPGEQADLPTEPLVLHENPAGHYVHVVSPSLDNSPTKHS